ncbi:MAG: helix-turn-helix domain-containing protein [Ruminococcaceae bacterium]|nr:helix-turn-helix domain-containing protein [Oscillospiraceae bacterium]
MNIGSLIKKLRTERNLSQEELGSMLGVQRAAVQKWECGTVKNLKRETLKKLSEIFEIPSSYFIDENYTNYSNVISFPKMNRIPLVGTIACGTPILANENLDGEVTVPEDINADFALRCKGDSMIDARIHNGDIVYIRQQPTVENGEIAAVLIDEEATLKRVYISDNTITLVACNSKYQPFVYTGEQLNQIHILGKAVGFTSTII